MRNPLKHRLENDTLYQLLKEGTADSEAQKDVARWILGLYENPDYYDREIYPDGTPVKVPEE